MCVSFLVCVYVDSVCICVCLVICICVSVCVYLCVYVFRGCVCPCVSMCVYVSVYVCKEICVCVCERECVCVWERERERDRVCVRESVWVWERGVRRNIDQVNKNDLNREQKRLLTDWLMWEATILESIKIKTERRFNFRFPTFCLDIFLSRSNVNTFLHTNLDVKFKN